MKGKAFFLWLLLLFVTFATTGCLKEQSTGSQKTEKNGQNAADAADVMDNIPIPVEEGEFNRVYGWLDSNTILYSTNGIQGTNVYAYNLSKGTNRHITTSKSMIVSIDISDSGEYLFIRSSSGPSTSLITITKKDGSVVFSHTLNAFDLTMEWNPYDEQQIFIAAFSEDWREQIYFLSIADKKITEAAYYDPFSKWYALEQLVYLNWIGENTALSADLILQDLNSGEEKKLLSGILHLDTFQNVFMTIERHPGNNDQAVYHFYGKNMKELGSFVTPQVSSFSSQLIPYYDYQAEKKTFIFFQPVLIGEKDMYDEEFQLMKFDADANQVQEIMDGLKNEPLSCSPDGSYCLYGYNFEKLIDLNKKKIMKLIS